MNNSLYFLAYVGWVERKRNPAKPVRLLFCWVGRAPTQPTQLLLLWISKESTRCTHLWQVGLSGSETQQNQLSYYFVGLIYPNKKLLEVVVVWVLQSSALAKAFRNTNPTHPLEKFIYRFVGSKMHRPNLHFVFLRQVGLSASKTQQNQIVNT